MGLIVCFIVVVFIFAAFPVYEIWMRRTGRRFLNLAVTDKDGTRRIVRVRAGRDPEVDELIKQIEARSKNEN